ncbi:hypothetical protein LTR91_003400 [Friedmanniomyces endolithicus]|uniref:Cytochrome b5 heme-binding domain-containing protein n=2 Tax=Dothideomycetidae TaxID=451867 RepID=A0AAN6J9A8_9PEZI|nr:hypothetical protein LTS09_016562 [Friedmanniomyces endolithicus]KAK5147387.1 hypothetical protein LTR32_001180 [Rachicladosporium monterosium]KAK0277810.1 hypothetical protein LTR35_009646 [Friedmanniomyces endolithicus]KAK0301147.1 hypothetical protein LTS00_000296 [Friedmanniomyces endolithicus]KAK0321262.1 hypothetical protein LTR82_007714 [Friedmanniomyces endolithicus]
MSKQFTASDVKDHSTQDKVTRTPRPSPPAHLLSLWQGLYIIIDNSVYEMSGFVDEHPGGAKILKRVGGKDASKQFWKYHNESVLKKYQERLKIGELKESAKL